MPVGIEADLGGIADGDLLVVRMWRWDADKLIEDAERSRREAVSDRLVDCNVSVYAMVKRPAESVEGLAQRLCRYLIDERGPRARRVAFTTGQRLQTRGFHLRLAEPPPHHYDLILGPDEQSADYGGAAREFDNGAQRKVKSWLQQ